MAFYSRNYWLYEDLRTNAAELIFNSLVEKEKTPNLSLIADQAKFLGRSGQYPYRAIASVIDRLSNSSTDEANELVNDALGFYSTETGFYNRDEEFRVLLRTLSAHKNISVNPGLVARAYTRFAERLTRDPIALPGRYYSEVHLSDGSIISFTDRNEAFLFLAFPVIRNLNKGFVDQLLQAHPELNRSGEGMVYISGGFVLGNPSSEEEARQHLQWLQESMVEQIKHCTVAAPQLATRLSQRLTNSSARIVGISATVPTIVRQSPADARMLYKTEIADLSNLSDPFEKLQALVALSQAAHSVGDAAGYERLSSEAQDIGIQLFVDSGKANPKLRIQRRVGFNELQELTTFAAALPSNSLTQKVQKLPDDWLKAYLLLYDAEGLAKPLIRSSAQNQSDAQASCIE